MLDKDFPGNTIQFPADLLDAHCRILTNQILPPVAE
jgi:hypothetical protein